MCNMTTPLCYTKSMSDTEPKSDQQLTVVPAAGSRKIARAVAASIVVPAIVADAGDTATKRFLEFFAVTIRNKNTRTAYLHAASRFFAWCQHHQLGALDEIEPPHVAAYIEVLGKDFEKPTVKQRSRHSSGYYLANKGYDLRLIQDYLGHRNPKHTVHTHADRSQPVKRALETLTAWRQRRRSP
jgi:Phage integrase family